MGPTTREQVFKESSASRALAGGAWQVVASILGGILLFAWVILGGRPPPSGFGPEGFQFYLSANALLMILYIPALGINQAAIKFVSEAMTRDPEEARRVAARSAGLLFLLGALVLLLAALFVVFAVSNAEDRLSFALVALVVPFMYLREAVNAVTGAMHRFDYLGIVMGILGAGAFGFGAVFLLGFHGPEHAKFLGLVPVLAMVAASGFAVWFFARCSPFPLSSLLRGRIDRAFAKRLGSYALFCLLANLAASGVILQVSLFLVKLMSLRGFVFDDAAVGVYGVSTVYAWVAAFIAFLSYPLVPEVSRAKERGDAVLLGSILRTVTKFSFAIGVVLVALFAVLAEPILRIFNGPAYAAGGGPAALVLSVAGMVLYAVASVFGAILVGIGRARFAGSVFGLGALVLILLTPILAVGMGLPGPALAILLSGGMVLPILMWRARQELGAAYPPGLVLRPILAAVPLALLFGHWVPGLLQGAGLLHALPLVAALGVGLLVAYLLLLTVLGNFGEEDFETIRDTLVSFGLGFLGAAAAGALRRISRASPLARWGAS